VSAFGKDSQPTLAAALQDGYEFVAFVGLLNDSLVILGHPESSTEGKN
jgi:hypothetical protein